MNIFRVQHLCAGETEAHQGTTEDEDYKNPQRLSWVLGFEATRNLQRTRLNLSLKPSILLIPQ